MNKDGTRHDPETIALGLSKIARIRTQLREPNPGTAPTSGAPQARTPADDSRPVDDEHMSLDNDQWTPDRIATDMASAAMRDDLQGRVVRLEAEVAQLRAALAAVLNAAATGLQAPASAVDPARSDSFSRPSTPDT
jgi:hypothetical protein